MGELPPMTAPVVGERVNTAAECAAAAAYVRRHADPADVVPILEVLGLAEQPENLAPRPVVARPAPTGRPSSVDPADVARWVASYGAGMTCPEIAEAEGVSKNTVYHRLRRAGVDMRPRGWHRQEVGS